MTRTSGFPLPKKVFYLLCVVFSHLEFHLCLSQEIRPTDQERKFLVEIKSNPPRAKVMIGSTSKGVTPVRDSVFPGAKRDFKVSKEYYVDSVFSVRTGASDTVVAIDLQKAGRIYISSDLESAYKEIDGESYAPFSRGRDLRPGKKYGVLVSGFVDGKETEKRDTVEVRTGQLLKLAFLLKEDTVLKSYEPIDYTPRGFLTCATQPDSAIIYSGSDSIGTSPLSRKSLPTGRQTLRASKDGYADWVCDTVIVEDEELVLNVPLKKKGVSTALQWAGRVLTGAGIGYIVYKIFFEPPPPPPVYGKPPSFPELSK